MTKDLVEEVRTYLSNSNNAGIKRCLENIYQKAEKGQFQMKYNGDIHCTMRSYSCPLQEEDENKVYCLGYKLLQQMR